MTTKEEFCLSAQFGSEGPAGAPGKDGLTPFINAAGNWQIGPTDTGVKAQAENGSPGKDGLTPFVNEAGNWQIGPNDTGVAARAKDGRDGQNGASGQDASVDVAGTETLDPEEKAEVINQGTTQNAKLFFKIPRGERGEETTLRQPHYDSFEALALAHPTGTVQEAYVVGSLNDVYIWDPVVHNWVSVGRLGWLPAIFEDFKNETTARLTELSREVGLRLTLEQANGLYAPKQDTYSKTEVDELIKQCKPEEYELPAATADTLGGVKVGAGLTMDENGVLSADEQAKDPGDFNDLENGPAIDGQKLTSESTAKGLGLFAKNNLLGGNAITIDEVPPEGGIDEYTKACWHFDKDGLDAVGGVIIPRDNTFNNLRINQLNKKFGEGSAAGFPRFDYFKTSYNNYLVNAAAWNLNSDADFTVDFWVTTPKHLNQTDFRFGFLNGSSNKIYATVKVKADKTITVWPSTVKDTFSTVDGLTFYGPADTDKSATVEMKEDWAHLAATYDGTAKKMSVFVDGVRVLEEDYSDVITGDYVFMYFGFAATVDQSGAPAWVDELRVSSIIRYENNFTPATMPYCGDAENTGQFFVNWHKPEEESGADITKYLTNCVLEAPNGGVAKVSGRRWYDYWGTLSASQKADRSAVYFTSSLQCKNHYTQAQLNGNWVVISKVKFVYDKISSTGVGGRIVSVGGKRITSPNTNTSFADIRLKNVSNAIGTFKAIIFPTDWTDTESYVINSNVAPELDKWYWTKLQKNGNTFTLSYSTDGINYTVLGSLSNVPEFEEIVEDTGQFLLSAATSTATKRWYYDLSSNKFNNLFLGEDLTPLITYEETPDSIKINKGLKVLIPNELNADGTLKNIIYVLPQALEADIPTENGKYFIALYQDGSAAFYKKESLKVAYTMLSVTLNDSDIWYSPKFNYFKIKEAGSWQIKYFAIVGEVDVSNGIIKESSFGMPANLTVPNMNYTLCNVDYVVDRYDDGSGNGYVKYKSGALEQWTRCSINAHILTWPLPFPANTYHVLGVAFCEYDFAGALTDQAPAQGGFGNDAAYNVQLKKQNCETLAFDHHARNACPPYVTFFARYNP